MYLAAQRVRSPAGQEGINAFFYVHGPHAWSGDPPPEVLPENNPGELVAQRLQVPPPGNRVRSYLDIVAPDGSSDVWLVGVLRHLALDAALHPLPWNVVHDGCLCRFHLEQALLPRWREELARLLQSAILARRTAPEPQPRQAQ